MNRPKRFITMYSLVLLLIFPLHSFSMLESGKTVTQRDAVDDDYYAAGGTVDINTVIAGDAVVAGGELFIGDHVKGDVIAAGGSIYLSGKIQDDVRVAGGDITVDATIGDDLIASGGRINVSADSIAGGDVWLAAGDVRVAGTVNRDLVIGAGSIRISGTVHGDVKLEAGEIQILEGTIIDGNLHYRSPREANIHPAAIIAGDVSYEYVEWEHSHRGTAIFSIITMIVASIVLFKLFPGFTLSAVGRVSADPLKSLGAGFLTLIIVPVVAILLISIVLGVWVGLSIFAFYFVALLTGMLVSFFFVGDWAARRLNIDITTTARRLFSVTIAVVVLGLLNLVPVIGCLLVFALLLSGLGAVMLQLKDAYYEIKYEKGS